VRAYRDHVDGGYCRCDAYGFSQAQAVPGVRAAVEARARRLGLLAAEPVGEPVLPPGCRLSVTPEGWAFVLGRHGALPLPITSDQGEAVRNAWKAFGAFQSREDYEGMAREAGRAMVDRRKAERFDGLSWQDVSAHLDQIAAALCITGVWHLRDVLATCEALVASELDQARTRAQADQYNAERAKRQTLEHAVRRAFEGAALRGPTDPAMMAAELGAQVRSIRGQREKLAADHGAELADVTDRLRRAQDQRDEYWRRTEEHRAECQLLNDELAMMVASVNDREAVHDRAVAAEVALEPALIAARAERYYGNTQRERAEFAERLAEQAEQRTVAHLVEISRLTDSIQRLRAESSASEHARQQAVALAIRADVRAKAAREERDEARGQLAAVTQERDKAWATCRRAAAMLPPIKIYRSPSEGVRERVEFPDGSVCVERETPNTLSWEVAPPYPAESLAADGSHERRRSWDQALAALTQSRDRARTMLLGPEDPDND
jgi:hypothetical protein